MGVVLEGRRVVEAIFGGALGLARVGDVGSDGFIIIFDEVHG